MSRVERENMSAEMFEDLLEETETRRLLPDGTEEVVKKKVARLHEEKRGTLRDNASAKKMPVDNRDAPSRKNGRW